MDDAVEIFTILTILIFISILLIIILYRYLIYGDTYLLRSYKDEKITLSAHNLFKNNGYMIYSGSELLLSANGNFKRFDTLDTDTDGNHTKTKLNLTPKQTTALWNLPQADYIIPPQPLRPAPALQVANSTLATAAAVVQPLVEENHILTNSSQHLHYNRDEMLLLNKLKIKSGLSTSPKQQNFTVPAIKMPIKSPPATTNSSTEIAYNNHQSSDSINQRSTTTNPSIVSEDVEEIFQDSKYRNGSITHTNTNPFLDAIPNECSKSNSYTALNSPNGGNPFVSQTNLYGRIEQTLCQRSIHNSQQKLTGKGIVESNNSNVSLKNIANIMNYKTANLNSANPFTKVVEKVKGPHLLQKTISEDFLFRKLSTPTYNDSMVANNTNISNAANNTQQQPQWSFGRMLMQDEPTFHLWKRNTSQNSLYSEGVCSIDSAQLERAVSCESVDSNSSLGLSSTDTIEDTSAAYTQITGYLNIGLLFADKTIIKEDSLDITVSVLEAKGLILPFQVESLDTFVRIYLVPDQAGATQTKVVINSPTPIYNESFNFTLKRHNNRHSLWFHLYHNGEAHTLIGEAEMEIGETSPTITTWIPLTDSRKCNARWGELMFSLSYLPTAERLTIVLVKARNLQLRVPNNEDPDILHNVQHIFIKVYLMNNDKKVLKKRTSVKRKDRSPVFNESVIFKLPPHNLTTAQIRFTVYGLLEDATITPLGHIITGSCATGKGLRHWHQMLSSLRKPVAMWHVLRHGRNQPVFPGGAEAVIAAMQNSAQRAAQQSNGIDWPSY